MGKRGIFYSLLRDKKGGVFGTLKVLLKDNVSTNYVADCMKGKWSFYVSFG